MTGREPNHQRHVLSTAEGTRPDAFGSAEWGLLVSVALIWGSSFLLIAIGLEDLSPGVITFLRSALGLLTLSLFPAARRGIDRSDWQVVVLLAVLWLVIPLTLFPIAQQWIDSSLAGMINGAVPLVSTLVAAILLRRAPGRTQGVGLLLGFAGIVLITMPGFQAGGSTLLGVVLVMIATACYGVAVNIAVPLQQRYGALPVLWWALLLSTLVTLPFGALSIGSSTGSAGSFAAVGLLGSLGTGIAFVAMATLVGRAGSTRGAVAVYFIPVVAVALGVIVRSEEVPPIAFGGIAAVIAGAVLVSRPERAASKPSG